MIIRPVCRRNFVALPNVVLTDERLSIETRGMIAYLLSRPPNWQIKTVWLARALSKKGQAVGRTKLTRMLREAKTAGYLARSAEQERKPNGDFGSYIYIIGLPEEVQLASARLAQSQGAASQDATSQDEHRIDKRRTPKNQNLKNIHLTRYGSHPLPLPVPMEPPQTADDGFTAFGRAASLNGMQFAFEDSEPFNAWRKVRGADGMPPIDVVVVQGRRRRGSWFTSLFPRNAGRAR